MTTLPLPSRAWVAAACFMLSFSCPAAPDKLAAELQERCAMQAAAQFTREFGAADTVTTNLHALTNSVHNYQHHYNAKLGACIQLVRSINSDARRGWALGESLNSENQTLLDLKQNRVIGRYFKLTDQASPDKCWVGRGVCRSKKEWDLLIQPYVKD